MTQKTVKKQKIVRGGQLIRNGQLARSGARVWHMRTLPETEILRREGAVRRGVNAGGRGDDYLFELERVILFVAVATVSHSKDRE